ncbi:hypothetical protein KKA04_03655 [Patescibacteria group bacterium]|nr:hypothetical protein [Patescibacteria group bacterium]
MAIGKKDKGGRYDDKDTNDETSDVPFDINDLNKVPGPEEGVERPEDVVTQTRTDVTEDLAGRTESGDNIKNLSEAIRKDELLDIVFFHGSPVKKLKKKGYKISKKSELSKIVDEILATSDEHEEAKNKGYTPAKSLTVAALDQHGFESDMLPDFADMLDERLKEQTEKAKEPATPAPTPTTPEPAPAPKPEPVPTAKAKAPEAVTDDEILQAALKRIEAFTDIKLFEKFVYQRLHADKLIKKDKRPDWSVTPVEGFKGSEALCKAVMAKKAELSTKKKTAEPAPAPTPEPTPTPEPPVGAASEKEALDGLSQYLNNLTEGQTALEDLRKRLEQIFEILRTDPSTFSETDKDYLTDIQKEMEAVLLSELPKVAEGIGSPKNMTELLAALRAPGKLRRNKAAMTALNSALKGDAEFAEIIEDFYRITGKEPAVAAEEPSAAPETVPEPTDIPPSLASAINAAAAGDDIKKRKLHFLWRVYKGEASFADGTDPEPVKTLIMIALDQAENLNVPQDEVVDTLNLALKKAGMLEASEPSAPAPTPTPPSAPAPTPTPPSAPPAAPTPSTTPAPQPSASPQASVNAGAQRRAPESYATKEIQTQAINTFMTNMGFPKSNKTPVVMAIRSVLGAWVTGPSILTGLEAYLKTGHEADEIERLARNNSEEDLKKQLHGMAGELAGLNQQIEEIKRYNRLRYTSTRTHVTHSVEAKALAEGHPLKELQSMQHSAAGEFALNEIQLKRVAANMAKEDAEPDSDEKKAKMEKLEKEFSELTAKKSELEAKRKYLAEALVILSEQATPVTEEDAETRGKKIRELEEQKSKLDERKRNTEKAIAKKTELKDEEPLRYSREPEKLLSMINFYFAQQGKAANKKPDYVQILNKTQEQIEATRRKEAGKLNWVCNRLLPWNYLKPLLTSTLVAICEKDSALTKKVPPEKAKELAKAWDNSESVNSWISGLGIPEKEAMETVVPKLIAHLAIVTNTGRMANINSISLNRAKALLKKMRHAVHEYSIKHAERSTSKKSIDRMGAYFTQYNQINDNAKAQESIVVGNSRKVMARNAFIAGGIGVGAVQILSLSGIALGGAGLASAAGIMTGASLRVKDPKIKEFLRKASVRTLVGGGLGALALGAASPFVAAPLGLAALGGVFSPEIWKKRKEIAAATKKHGPGALRTTGKVGYVGARLGWAATGILLSCGVLMLSSRYRNLFGMHFRPLLGK